MCVHTHTHTHTASLKAIFQSVHGNISCSIWRGQSNIECNALVVVVAFFLLFLVWTMCYPCLLPFNSPAFTPLPAQSYSQSQSLVEQVKESAANRKRKLWQIRRERRTHTHTYTESVPTCVRVCVCARWTHVHSCVQPSEVYGANKMYFMLP